MAWLGLRRAGRTRGTPQHSNRPVGARRLVEREAPERARGGQPSHRSWQMAGCLVLGPGPPGRP
eukprot:5228350-Lingulodinium_polyedra.AAC.1